MAFNRGVDRPVDPQESVVALTELRKARECVGGLLRANIKGQPYLLVSIGVLSRDTLSNKGFVHLEVSPTR